MPAGGNTMSLSTPSGVQNLARVYGHPGEAPRSMGWLKMMWPVLLAAFLGGYLIRAAIPLPGLSATQAGLLLILLCAATMGWMVRGEQSMHRYLKGAEGEEEVARLLSLLPSDFAVFHGLRLPGLRGGARDFDHIVVGPSGVIVIETKNWRDRVRLEGQELHVGDWVPDRPPLEQLRGDAVLLEHFLRDETGADVEIQAILCFVSNRFGPGIEGAAGVTICNADQLLRVVRESSSSPLPQTRIQTIEQCLAVRLKGRSDATEPGGTT